MSRLFALEILPETHAVVRLASEADLPSWALAAPDDQRFRTITRTQDELSVVCPEEDVPADIKAKGGWRGLRVAGVLAFEEVGVLSALAGLLAEAGVSLLAIGTHDTDYLFVQQADFETALAALRGAGHQIRK